MTTQPPPALPSTSNGLATCSLICGIAGFLTGPLTGIVAIITGHAAQRKIRHSGGVVGGSGAANTGLVPILASPETVDFRGGAGRIVVHVDSSTKVIPERDYQSQIRRQSTPTP